MNAVNGVYIRAEAIVYPKAMLQFKNQEIERRWGKIFGVKDVHAIEAHHEGKSG